MRHRPDPDPRPAPEEDPHAHPYSSGSGADAFDPSLIGQLLLFRWRLIAGVTLLALLAAGVYLSRAPRVYAARATVQVEGEPRRVTNFDEVSAEDLRTTEALKTLEAVLTARPLLRAVAEANHLADRPDFIVRKPGSPLPKMDDIVDTLMGRIGVSLRRGTRLIDLTVEDGDPVLARELADSLLAEFAAQRLGESAGVSQVAQQLLTRQAEELRSKLEKSEAELQNYREKTRAVSLEEGQNIIAGKLRDLNTKVTEAKGRRVELESAVSQVRSLLNPPSGQRITSLTAALLEVPPISTSPEVSELRRQLHEREAELAIIEKRYLYKHPRNIWTTNQIAQLRTALDRATAKAAEVVENSYRAARETEVALETALIEQESAAMDLNRVAGPYQVLQRQVQSDRALYDSVLTRLKQTDVLAGVQPGMGKSGIRIVEPPVASSRPIKPSRLRILLLALVAGLVAGVGAAVVRELFNASFRTVDDAEKGLHLPGLAAVPEAGRRGRQTPPAVRDLPMVHAPGSHQAEAFRSLRASLEMLEEADGRSVLFTSAIPGEGKTYCAANYAVALAQQGLITLFISADLRRPRADDLLGRPNAKRGSAPGLTDCLEDGLPLAQGVCSTEIRNLCLLPAGRRVPNPSELLTGNGFPKLLASALAVFDRVVVDTPPVQAVSDAMLVARHVGAVCLVVRAERSPRRVVQRSHSILERAGVRPIGFVFNRLSTGAGSRYRYYLYGDTYTEETAPAASSGR